MWIIRRTHIAPHMYIIILSLTNVLLPSHYIYLSSSLNTNYLCSLIYTVLRISIGQFEQKHWVHFIYEIVASFRLTNNQIANACNRCNVTIRAYMFIINTCHMWIYVYMCLTLLNIEFLCRIIITHLIIILNELTFYWNYIRALKLIFFSHLF